MWEIGGSKMRLRRILEPPALTFVDRYNVPSGQEWLRGAILSAVFIVIIALPWFKKRIYGEV